VPLAYPSSGCQYYMRRWLCDTVSSDWIVWSAACSSEQRLSVLYASLAL
jgi:hypothetical protein